ncbi:MAG TPA: hypothetical protein VHG93_02365 [Longimicrobium sp.]|nr:hypothetical protein [Longimicrobium sp.]
MPIHPRCLLLLAATLAACGSDRPADGAGGTSPASADSALAAVERGRADTLAAASGALPPESAITLSSDGLEVIAGGVTRALAFGTAQTRVLTEVGGVLGAPAEQGTMDECPAGPLYQVGYGTGLQLVFQDSAFVGWFARQGSPFRTAREIGPGSTLRQLKTAYSATKVEETSLGYEFDAGGLYGVVTDTTDAGVVEVVFAGTNCIFR